MIDHTIIEIKFRRRYPLHCFQCSAILSNINDLNNAMTDGPRNAQSKQMLRASGFQFKVEALFEAKPLGTLDVQA